MIKEHLHNERGNITLLVMGGLSLMVVLFVLILNIGSFLGTKEQSATTAKQASIAATSVLYEEVKNAIFDYDDHEDEDWEDSDEEEEEDAFEFFDEFKEKVEEEKEKFSGWEYNDWSDHEIELKAVGIVIEKGLSNPILKTELRSLLNDNEIRLKTRHTARKAIVENGGTLKDAKMEIKEGQIHIKAANEFQSSNNRFLRGIKKDVFQESAGPEVSFLDEVFKKKKTYNLDDNQTETNVAPF